MSAESAEYVVSVVRSWQNWGNWNEAQRAILEDIIYHLEQAERVRELKVWQEKAQQLHESLKRQDEVLDRFRQQNKRYREALEEIVHQENLKETNVFGYDHEDISSYVEEVARKALEESE